MYRNLPSLSVNCETLLDTKSSRVFFCPYFFIPKDFFNIAVTKTTGRFSGTKIIER